MKVRRVLLTALATFSVLLLARKLGLSVFLGRGSTVTIRSSNEQTIRAQSSVLLSPIQPGRSSSRSAPSQTVEPPLQTVANHATAKPTNLPLRNVHATSSPAADTETYIKSTKPTPEQAITTVKVPVKPAPSASMETQQPRYQQVSNAYINNLPAFLGITWKQFLALPRQPSGQNGRRSRYLVDPSSLEICDAEVERALERPQLTKKQVDWCNWALSPQGGAVRVGKSWGNLKDKQQQVLKYYA
jgi:hypothetical protein